MNPFDQDYPWMFRRDDIDLLEDELEDLYERFHAAGTALDSFEAAVLQEQIETEERSDQELSFRLGFDVLEEPPEPFCSARAHEESDEVPREFKDTFTRVRHHPLYQMARSWADLIRPFAKRGYEQGVENSHDLFRIYANVNLVPLKIFLGLCEECHEDQIGFEVAQEEYYLALTYLVRILESLTLITFSIEDMSWLDACQRGAHELRDCVRAQVDALNRRKSSQLGML